jgi:hypothetical protein
LGRIALALVAAALLGLSAVGAGAGAGAALPHYAACVNRTFTAFDWRIRPKACVMAKTSDPAFAEAANLVGLRWSAWGGAHARATGYERGFHLPYSHVPVRVELTLPVHPAGDRSVYVYKRFRVTSKYGTLSGIIKTL